MLPQYVNKNAVKYITLNITPELAEYVAGIKSTLEDTNIDDDKLDDVIYITKIIAFFTKFLILSSSAAISRDMKNYIQDFIWAFDHYKTEITSNIQAIIGVINGSAITQLQLPISDNILDVINELKQCVQNWFNLHKEDIEYEGCRHLTSEFLYNIYKYVYLFRYSKISDPNYADGIKYFDELYFKNVCAKEEDECNNEVKGSFAFNTVMPDNKIPIDTAIKF